MAYVSHRGLSGVADMGTSDIIALGNVLVQLMGADRKSRLGAVKNINALLATRLPSPFMDPRVPPVLGNERITPLQWPAYKGPMTSADVAAISSYQKTLLPWFENVLAKTAQIVSAGKFGLGDAEKIVDQAVRKAENVLRQWGIDPANVYQQLAQTLHLNPTDFSSTYTAQTIVGNQAPTTAQAINTQVLQQTPNVVAPPTLTIPNAPSANPVYLAPPPAPATDVLQSPAPVSAAPTSTVAAATPATINWERWAMPFAIIAAAAISFWGSQPHNGNGSNSQ